ncbi:MAG TPA: patatin-like phospholipase family protein [Candidatus Kryptobacter bacterium]|nr:patatin-like phospholipase family protein [Candidatus Kryptobacter bacterium]
MSKYRILSLDGGGIRGIITASLLHRLGSEPRLTGFLEKVDLLAGTSTGGLLALALANGVTPGEMRDIYAKEGSYIFWDTLIHDVKSLWRIIGAGYSNKHLEDVLLRVFGDTTLDQLKKRVLITAFDLSNGAADIRRRSWKPKIFHNFEGEDSDGKQPAYKVGLYTSAAPTYFPTTGGYVDGGVFANNPSMCALAQSQDLRFFETPRLGDVVMLSLGTGSSLTFIEGKRHDWGYAQWVRPILNLMLDGVAGLADYECKQMLKDNYHRLAPVFPHDVSVPMDAADMIPYMLHFAEHVELGPAIEWLERNWMR